MKYKALLSFTQTNKDYQLNNIYLESDFDSQEKIEEYLSINYIVEYDGSLDITENGNYDVKDYEEVDVNVSGSGGLDWSILGFESTPEAIVIGYNRAKDIKDNWVVKSSYANEYEANTNIMIFPVVDLSSATNVTEMFSACYCLIAVGDMNCSNATSFNRLFGNCSALKSIGVIDCSGVSNSSGAYYMFNNVSNLEYIGGLKDLGKSFSNSWSVNSFTLDLSPCTKLSHDSLMNVINSVYDLKTKGAKNQEIKVGSTNLAKLSEAEIQMASDKGWNVVAS